MRGSIFDRLLEQFSRDSFAGKGPLVAPAAEKHPPAGAVTADAGLGFLEGSLLAHAPLPPLTPLSPGRRVEQALDCLDVLRALLDLPSQLGDLFRESSVFLAVPADLRGHELDHLVEAHLHFLLRALDGAD
jgi:hypothetical protein